MTKLVFLVGFITSAVVMVGLGGVVRAEQEARVDTKIDDVRIELRVVPSRVSPGDPFRIDLLVHNLRRDPLVLVSRAECIAFPAAYREREPVWMTGMHNGCVARPDTFRIAPGEERRERWNVRTRSREGTLLAPGVYSLRMHLNVDELPELVSRVRVR